MFGNIRRYLGDLWVVMPMGAGALVGIVAHDAIDPMLRQFGFKDISQKLAGLLVSLIGIYFFTNYSGFKENLGMGFATMGSVLFMVGLFDLDELYEL